MTIALIIWGVVYSIWTFLLSIDCGWLNDELKKTKQELNLVKLELSYLKEWVESIELKSRLQAIKEPN